MPGLQGRQAPPRQHAVGDRRQDPHRARLAPDAPPILQWDREDKRNPVSWYVWTGPCDPSQYGLVQGWHELSAITLLPTMWNGGEADHHGEGAYLIVRDARETRTDGQALFPETLRSELREIRSTIEAYSRLGDRGDPATADASGLMIRSNSAKRRIRVKSGSIVTEYTIDRWD